ncbi:solute carrier family 35 member D2-like protein [Tachypleus tridentatus]|uniref:solute carrier family 35 member D2-like protein n=1 Tax=Tachypleus tridentatus TaxID=6853 RepID=UPI003FD39C2C
MFSKSSHNLKSDATNIYIHPEEITSKTPVPLLYKILSALLYAGSSFLITVINKVVLTYYRFPCSHTLGLGQMIVTLFILSCGKTLGCLTFPDFSCSIPLKIWPLPLFYFGNLITGLGSTQRLSLPMFTVLRRFTILMTMVGEYIVLKVRQPCIIVVTVFVMVGGTVVAASTDLAFDLSGYVLVLSNNFCTAANNVYLKKKIEMRDLGKFGLLFYNVFFMFAPLMYITWLTGGFSKVIEYDQWTNLWFLTWFLLSCTVGFILMYSTIVCTQYNSPLTTSIVGSVKNILVSYLGMYVGGDYVFSITNFIGLNISMLGSVVYTYLIFVQKKEQEVVPTKEDSQNRK